MKPRHSQQLALLRVVLCAALALCLMPVVTHAQEQKPLVFTFRPSPAGNRFRHVTSLRILGRLAFCPVGTVSSLSAVPPTWPDAPPGLIPPVR
jgi:hypothetical protein